MTLGWVLMFLLIAAPFFCVALWPVPWKGWRRVAIPILVSGVALLAVWAFPMVFRVSAGGGGRLCEVMKFWFGFYPILIVAGIAGLCVPREARVRTRVAVGACGAAIVIVFSGFVREPLESGFYRAAWDLHFSENLPERHQYQPAGTVAPEQKRVHLFDDEPGPTYGEAISQTGLFARVWRFAYGLRMGQEGYEVVLTQEIPKRVPETRPDTP